MARAQAYVPDITDAHRRAAFVSLRWMGSYHDAMSAPFRARLIEARAHDIARKEWEATTTRTVQHIPRAVLGCDGHPIGYITQTVPGPRVPTPQPDLF